MQNKKSNFNLSCENVEQNLNQNIKAKMKPLITSSDSSSSESVSTVLNEFQNGKIYIPIYQRDSDQWSKDKKSLFLDSVLNNITVPSLIYAPNNVDSSECWMKKFEVVDGQQRINLLDDFKKNKFRLSPSKNINYISGNSAFYENKVYDELPDTFKHIFDNYKITIIYLSENLDNSAKLETFRRLNQEQYTLSAQDIRLSQNAYSKISNFIKASGVFDYSKNGGKRILDYSLMTNVSWPWKKSSKSTQDAWREWWHNKKSAKGQGPSEMILWYIIGLYYNKINDILSNNNFLITNLKMPFIDSIENVADIVLAFLNFEENNKDKILCSFEELENDLFPKFISWFKFCYDNCPSSFNVKRYRLMAFVIAALTKYNPDILQVYHIDKLDKFLFKPRDTTAELGISYPETKGKWNSQKGLYNQIQSIYDIIDNILE